MSQNDMVIANQGFAAFRADLNGALAALASTSKGTARPATPYAGQLWLDDNTPSATLWSLNVYDGVDDVVLGWVDATNNRFVPWAGVGARVVSKTGAYTLAQAERGELHTVSHATGFTVTLLAAATASNGFTIGFLNVGAADITLDGNGAETIDGQATINLPAGQSITLLCDGTNWRTLFGGFLPAGVRAHKGGTDQTAIAASTATKVTFATEAWDTQGDFASSTFTAKHAGIYQVSAQVRFNAIADGKLVNCLIYRNGAEHARTGTHAGAAAATVYAHLSVAVILAATDTIEIYAIQGDTVARDIEGDVQETWVSIMRVA